MEATTVTATPSTELRDGVTMPLVGFGTHPLRGRPATEAVLQALETGYRSVDTAARYRNEDAVGAALRESPVPRSEVFVTTKLPPDSVGIEREMLETSLAALGLDQVDLWLLHWPPGGSAGTSAWRRMVALRDEGLVRAVGVSNFRIAQLDELHRATGEYPALVQRQWSPVHFSPRYLAECTARGVAVGAHSPLRSARLDDPSWSGSRTPTASACRRSSSDGTCSTASPSSRSPRTRSACAPTSTSRASGSPTTRSPRSTR
ncbi:aldo/keto reductase [Curtobacterium flaccumfaciens]|nr:aldo/keto reductase [Curtobacterium flaccumfaciens]